LENTSIRFEKIRQTFERASIVFGDTPIVFVKIHQTSGSASVGLGKIP
jgi:hypothetical protein